MSASRSLSAEDTSRLGFVAVVSRSGPSVRADIEAAIGQMTSARAKRIARAIAVEQGVLPLAPLSAALRAAAVGFLVWAGVRSETEAMPTSRRRRLSPRRRRAHA